MPLAGGARVAVVGAGPGGLVAAKYALEAGFDPVIFEASDDLGGQWHSSAPHSGIWPGMRTNTSSAMTAFSDFAPPPRAVHPTAVEVQAYLRAYAAHHGLLDRIRLATQVEQVTPGWRVDGEPFDAVVVASGRFRAPAMPPILSAFEGELLHAYDYAGPDALRGRRVLVYGNGISGLEIASDLAPHASVVSAFRKPRYVIQKLVDGVPSDWQWYTRFGALQRMLLPAAEWSRILRDRIVAVAGNPADHGAPAPDPDLVVAGLALCQDWLAQVRDELIACRPEIAAVHGRRVTFADGTAEEVDAIVAATGYVLDLPFLADDVWRVLGPGFDLYHRTLHPDLPGLGFVGQFVAQGPYFPLLELQGRWIAATWSGQVRQPPESDVRAAMSRPRPALDPHNVLATVLSRELGVEPDPRAWPELAEPLAFGPMLPARYRLQGPGAMTGAAELFAEQLQTARMPPVDAADVRALDELQRFQLAQEALAASTVR